MDAEEDSREKTEKTCVAPAYSTHFFDTHDDDDDHELCDEIGSLRDYGDDWKIF